MKQLLKVFALAFASLSVNAHASEPAKELGSNPAVRDGQEDNYEDRCVEAAFKNLSNSRFQKCYPKLTHHAFDK